MPRFVRAKVIALMARMGHDSVIAAINYQRACRCRLNTGPLAPSEF